MEPLLKFFRRETPHGLAMSVGAIPFGSLYYIEMLFTMTR